MGCVDCGPAATPVTEPPQIFKCALEGANVEVRVSGNLTAENLPLVQQYLVFVYDVISGAIPESHEGRFD